MTTQSPRSLSHALRMGAVMAVLAAAAGMFGALCVLAWIFPEALDRYLTRSLGSERLYRSIAATLPAAGFIGAFQAYFASRLLHQRPLSPLLGVVSNLYLLAGWSAFMLCLATRHVLILPLAGVCAVSYLMYLDHLAKGRPVRLIFALPALALPIAGLTCFVYEQGTGGLHDKLPFVALSSLWLADVLIHARLRRWRRLDLLKVEATPHFQFTLEAMLWAVLGGGAYVSFLIWLFPSPS